VTGDDHNTDALIAALRSPALPAERAGEAAAVTAMLGALARIPASTRFRAGRGIAIAVVTVASLGVGGFAAAGPGVFQAAANKARSLVTPDSADTEDAGAANGDDPLSGSQPDDTNGGDAATGALASAIQQAAAGDLGATPADAVTPTAPPPECVDGNHGDAVSPVANGSAPPSAEEDHGTELADDAQSACTPQTGTQEGNQVGTNPNKPEDIPAGPPASIPAHEPATPVTGPPDSMPPVAAPPITTPPRPPVGPPISTPGSGNGQGGNDGSLGGQGTGGQATGGQITGGQATGGQGGAGQGDAQAGGGQAGQAAENGNGNGG
jgi:hypothetical protein